jgi:hypothetical protein
MRARTNNSGPRIRCSNFFKRIQKCFLATVMILIWAPTRGHGIPDELVEHIKFQNSE